MAEGIVHNYISILSDKHSDDYACNIYKHAHAALCNKAKGFSHEHDRIQ